MLKKYSFIIIIIFLVFIFIPLSFAENNTDLNNYESLNLEITDNTILSVDDNSDEIHVDINGNDNNDGKYDTPLATIKKAINLSDDNSKIVIHEGVYKENNLNITKSLEIYGQGNVIIDGESLSRIITINTPSSDDKVLLSGITFTNGTAYQGGAIYVRGAMTTIDNSRFISNTALAQGGAIYWNSENGKLTNCIIENNSARDGAGVSWGESETSFSIGGGDYGQVINCTFDNNHIQQDDDGCIGLSVYSNGMKIINSKFINHETSFNTSFEVVYLNGDSATVEGCLFENNSMTLTSALGLDGNYAVARGNTFINNTVSLTDAFGGAIGIQSETGTIYNNTFISNGGDTCYGGAIFINIMEDHQFSFINITSNVFKDNKGYIGGCVYANGQGCMLDLKINNNTFDESKAVIGAGIYITDIWAPVIIVDNVFKNSIANSSLAIHSINCDLQILNNRIENSSSNDCDIYADKEVKTKLTLKFNNVTAIAGEPTNLTAILLDDMGNTIFTKHITFKIDGVDVKGKKGLNSISTTFSDLGKYTITGEFEYATLNGEPATLTVVNSAKLYVDNIVSYGNDVEIKANLTDSLGNPIPNAYIFINLKENDVLLVTDSSGCAKSNVNLDFGQYNLTARFDDVKYQVVSKTFTVDVLSSIKASDLNVSYNSANNFKAQLFNKDGSKLANTKVVFSINRKDYNVTTDLDGVAILNEKLNVGYYQVIVNNLATAESSAYSLNIVKRITENSNINMYFGAGNSYKVRVFDDDGNSVGAGEIVKIAVNKKTYTRTTDSNGYASFKVTLQPGTYTITATYSGVKVSNKIVVKPVLTAKNISKKKAKTIKFTAKLVNTKGKVVKGKKITFKLKGKTYTSKTNKKGIATISLKNLKVGKYTITTKYGKSSIKNTIQIKK